MKRDEYKLRVIDKTIDNYLKAFGAVCIEGPKWCGKTWTSLAHCKSDISLADPRGSFHNRQLAQLDASLILNGEIPRLIDEWQEVPLLWDAVRFHVDHRDQKGQFILTGSSRPTHKGILHSGAGRIARIRMRPMSLFESGDSSGLISLQKLCEGELQNQITNEVKLTSLIDFIIRGGWPSNQNTPKELSSIMPKEYLNAILEDDIYRVDNVKYDKNKLNLLLRSLARNEATTVSNKKLMEDIKAIDNHEIVEETIANYMELLNRLFLIDNQRPYASNLRSSMRVKQREKRHLADPSLACALLGATEELLLNDLQTLGFLFEALCERDLKIYAEAFGAELYHYQDYANSKVDAVISLPSRAWCGFEIKLGANQIDEGAKNLLKLKKAIESDKKGGKSPKVLCVICGLTNAAYKREDGVFVVPITALGP